MKRSFKSVLSILSVFLIVFCLTIPIFASTVVPNPAGTRLSPVWNVSKIEVGFISGQTAILQLPEYFFSNSDELSIIEVLYYGPEEDNNSFTFSNIEIYPPSSGSNEYLLEFSLSLSNLTYIEFFYNDTLVPYSGLTGGGLGGSSAYYHPIALSNKPTIDGYYDITGSYNFYYAHNVYENDQVVDRRIESPGTVTFSNVSSDTGWALTPTDSNVHADAVIAMDNGPDSSDNFLLYSNITSRITVLEPTVGTTDTFRFSMPLAPSDIPGWSFPSYIRSNFPRSLTYLPESPELTGFGAFLSSALGGFLAFEFFPGFSLGLLFVCIVALLSIIAFLRWFAGG